MNAITNRAFLNAIITGELVIKTEDGTESKSIFDENGALISEITDYAAAEIEKINKKNDSRKGKLTAAQKANEQMKANLVAALTEQGADRAWTAKDIAEVFEINPQKASALARALVVAGVMTVEDVKGEKGKVKGYTLVEGATYEPITEDVESK